MWIDMDCRRFRRFGLRMGFMSDMKCKWYEWLDIGVLIYFITHLVLITTTVTTIGIALIVLKEVVRLHGIPESIVFNRDTQFTSIFWMELQKLMRTKLLMSTAFHPLMDGATEKANTSVAQILWTAVDNDQKNWSDKCSMAEFTINSSVNATTGYAPF